MTLSVECSLVDAFTRTRGEGNRAGVVPDAAGLDEATLQAAAKAVGASETSFVLPAEAGADVRLRYLTPSTEVPFCGHATVATFHRLTEMGRFTSPGVFTLACKAGQFQVELEGTGEAVQVWIVTPQFPWEPSPIAAERLLELLGAARGVLHPTLPILRAGPKIFLPFSKRADLWALAPRWEALANEGLRHRVTGFFAFTLETLDPSCVAHGRFFVPAEGIPEDPVTGAANGPLAAYLFDHGVLKLRPGEARTRAWAEQGYAMGKPGRIELEVSVRPEGGHRFRIGGRAVTVMVGELSL